MWTLRTGNKLRIVCYYLPNTSVFDPSQEPFEWTRSSWHQIMRPGFFIFLNTTGHMNATVLVLNSFSFLRGQMLRETDGVTWSKPHRESTDEHRKGNLNLAHTSDLFLLLFAHPVNSEAGCSSKTTPQNLLVRLSPSVGHRTWLLCGQCFKLLNCVLVRKMRCNSYICQSVDTKWCFDARCDMVSFYVTQLERLTRPGGRTGVALAAQLLQGVDSYVEVDVFAATALIHQLFLIKGLKQRKSVTDENSAHASLQAGFRTVWKAMSSDGQNLTHSSIKVLR